MKRTINITKSLLGMMIIAALVFIASCGSKEDPIQPPANVGYSNVEVEVGEAQDVAPATTGIDGTPSFSIDDDGGADFLSIDSSTGVLTVGKESTTGSYTVKIKITNSAGSTTTSLVVKVNVPTAFNPVGKKLLPMYFMNQTSNIQLIGLTGIPGLPFDTLDVPVGWPPAGTPPDQLMPYMLFGELTKIIWQVPGDNVCSIAGDTTLIVVQGDFTLSTDCSEGTPDSKTGDWSISYKEGTGYIFTLTFIFDATNNIVIPYAIGGAEFVVFSDPILTQDYAALHGTVDAFTTPTDYTDESTLTNPLTWKTPTIEVVMMVLNP